MSLGESSQDTGKLRKREGQRKADRQPGLGLGGGFSGGSGRRESVSRNYKLLRASWGDSRADIMGVPGTARLPSWGQRSQVCVWSGIFWQEREVKCVSLDNSPLTPRVMHYDAYVRAAVLHSG